MSFAADRRSTWVLVLALCASLLAHGLAVALAPSTRAAVAAATPHLVMFETVKPAPPAPPPPARVDRPVTRQPKRAAPAAPPPSAAVNDSQGEVAAPVSPEPTLKFSLAPFTSKPKADAPDPQVPAGPPVDTAASLESEVKPPYPEGARLEGVDGTVELRVTIGEDGRVLDAKNVSDPGSGLGEAARAAVMKARFKPATRNGQRVRSLLLWRYTFELR